MICTTVLTKFLWLGNVGGMSGMPSLSSILGTSRPSSGQSASSNSESQSFTETTQPSRSTTASTTQSSSTPASTTPTPAPASAPASSSSIQLSDLQNILSGLSGKYFYSFCCTIMCKMYEYFISKFCCLI